MHIRCCNAWVCHLMHVTRWLQDKAKAVETDPGYRTVLHGFAALHIASLINSCYVAGTYGLHPFALTGRRCFSLIHAAGCMLPFNAASL